MTRDELRTAVHRHLAGHPGLTAYELARVLGLANPRGGGGLRVKRVLRAMAEDGEASMATEARGSGDRRLIERWSAC